MMRVLIGYDGSEASDQAIDDLKWAGLPTKCEAIVLDAADVALMPASEVGWVQTDYYIAHSKEAVEQAQISANKAKERLQALFPAWDIKAEAHKESPLQALLNKADQWKANLLVVGAHGHSRLGRFLGSTSQILLVHASCSLRVNRARLAKTRSQTRVVIGFDGSSGAQLAVQTVQNRNWSKETQIRIVSAISHRLVEVGRVKHLVPPEIPRPGELENQERAAAIEMTEALTRQLRGRFSDVTTVVHDGDPKQIIVSEAQGWEADSIFVGARSLGQMRRFLLGSTSMAVAARAHCSVEVVRPAL
jgi:nucleotide-binding universal stress UspA family protein